jgi:hypothetical protein
MEPLVEHRQHPRHHVAYLCIFSPDGTHITDGFVEDLSLGGCRIKSPHPFRPGTSMELQIRPEHHAPVYVPYATVRWTEATTFGVEFTSLPDLEASTLTRLLLSPLSR